MASKSNRVVLLLKRAHNAISRMMLPEPPVAGLGRWSSTIPERRQFQHWFHDACSQDNCYLRWLPSPPLAAPIKRLT